MDIKPSLTSGATRVLLAVCAVAQLSAADAAKTTAALSALQETLTKYTLSTGSPDDKNRLVEMGNLANRIANRRSESGATNLPDEYVDSLVADTKALDSLPPEGQSRTAALANVHRDLQIKAKYSTDSFGITGGFAAIIDVSVETVRNGQPVNGLYVRCNPAAYGFNDPPLFPFNSASSPTSRKLPPGSFVLWVETADHKRITSQPLDIGENGKDSETIRIAVP